MQRISTRLANISYQEDNILQIEFPCDTFIELEDIIEIHKACEFLLKGKNI